MTLRMEGVLGLGDDRRIGAVVADESSKAAAPVRVESLLVAVDVREGKTCGLELLELRAHLEPQLLPRLRMKVKVEPRPEGAL